MNRFHTLLRGVCGALLLLCVASAALAFSVNDVIRLSDDGVPSDLIIQKIQYSGATFRLSADDMERLLDAQVPRSVISAMLATEERAQYQTPPRAYYDPYVSRPYYYQPRPRLGVGFGLAIPFHTRGYGSGHQYHDGWGGGFHDRGGGGGHDHDGGGGGRHHAGGGHR